MLFSAPAIVRWVKGNPMLSGHKNFHPCVGCHRTDQPLGFAVFPSDRRRFQYSRRRSEQGKPAVRSTLSMMWAKSWQTPMRSRQMDPTSVEKFVAPFLY